MYFIDEIKGKRKAIIFSKLGKGRYPVKHIDVSELANYILSFEKWIAKGAKELPAIFLNDLKPSLTVDIQTKIKNKKYLRATTSDFDAPAFVYLDIDFHSKREIEIFKKEYKYYNHNKTVEENLEHLKQNFSKYAWISADSKSKMGVRFVFAVNYLFEDDGEDTKDFGLVYKICWEHVAKLLCDKSGLKDSKLVDEKVKSIHMGTSPCRKEGSIVNKNHKPIFIDEVEETYVTRSYKNQGIKEYTDEEVTDLNNRFFGTGFTDKEYDELEEKLNICGELIEDIKHRKPVLINVLSSLKDERILHMFYKMYSKYYSGNSLTEYLRNFNTFLHYLNPSVRGWNRNIPFTVCLENYNIFYDKTNYDDMDTYGFKYDGVIKFKQWLSEVRSDIEVRIKTNRVVIKAGTGSGKTTVILMILDSTPGITVFVSPTNPLCDQVCANAKKANIEVHKLYGGWREIPYSGNGLIVTNFQGLKILEQSNIKLQHVVFDECHKLVEYSHFEEMSLWMPSCPHIYMSATPEAFLVGLSNFMYYNFVKEEKEKKREITIMPVGSEYMMMKRLNKMLAQLKEAKENSTDPNWAENNRILIFYNNKEIAYGIKEDYPEFDFALINSNNKKEPIYQNLINNEILIQNVVATSLINDGVNIKNEKWKYVLYLDNMTQTPAAVYQFMSRFRKCEPKVYYIYTYVNIKDTMDIEVGDYHVKDMMEDKLTSMMIDLTEKCELINAFDSDGEKEIITVDFIFKKDGKYQVNESQVKKYIHDDLYKKIRFKKTNLLKFLNFYFDIKAPFKYADALGGKRNDNSIVVKFYVENLKKMEHYFKHGTISIFTLDEQLFINKNYSRLNTCNNRMKVMNKLEQDFTESELEFTLDKNEALKIDKSKPFWRIIETERRIILSESDKNIQYEKLTSISKEEINHILEIVGDKVDFEILKQELDKRKLVKYDKNIYTKEWFDILGLEKRDIYKKTKVDGKQKNVKTGVTNIFKKKTKKDMDQLEKNRQEKMDRVLFVLDNMPNEFKSNEFTTRLMANLFIKSTKAKTIISNLLKNDDIIRVSHGVYKKTTTRT
jgi:hypothetical protein